MVNCSGRSDADAYGAHPLDSRESDGDMDDVVLAILTQDIPNIKNYILAAVSDLDAADAPDDAQDRLRSALQSWLDVHTLSYQDPTSFEIVIPLQHRYLDNSLSTSSMKNGRDRLLTSALRSLALGMGFVVYLTNMKVVTGSRSDMPNIAHTSFTLESVFGPHGGLKGKNVQVAEDRILQVQPVQDQKPSREKRGRAFVERCSRASAVVLLRKEHELEFLMQESRKPKSSPNQNITPVLREWTTRHQDKPQDPVVRQELQSICDYILEWRRSTRHNGRVVRIKGLGITPFADKIISDIVVAQVKAGWIDELEGTIDLIATRLSDTAMCALGSLIKTQEPDVVKPIFARAFSKCKTVDDFWDALYDFCGYPIVMKADVAHWTCAALEDLLQRAEYLDSSDGETLTWIMREVQVPNLLEQVILPGLERQCSNTRFILRFIVSWLEGRTCHDVTAANLRRAYSALLKDFRMSQPPPSSPHIRYSREMSGPDQGQKDLSRLTHILLSTDQKILERTEAEDLVRQLFSRIRLEAANGHATGPFNVFSRTYLPYLRSLQPDSKEAMLEPQRADMFRCLYQEVYAQYILRHVGPSPPQPPASSSGQDSECECRDCELSSTPLSQMSEWYARNRTCKRARVFLEARNEQREYHDWELRCKEAQDEFAKWDQEVLKALLVGRWEEITELRAIASGAPCGQEQSQGAEDACSVADCAASSRAGDKRKDVSAVDGERGTKRPAVAAASS